MHEIKCPSCGKTFKVDETSYAAILSQVHTQEFDEEIHEKPKQIERQHKTELELQEEKLKVNTNKNCQKKNPKSQP